MGHRKHNAPRRGSLAFYPRARHGLLVPRVRNWVMLGGDRPMLAGFPAFKVGMIHAIVVDDREKTPNFGKPTFNPATVVSLPDIHVYGVRAYTRIEGAERVLCDLFADELDEAASKRISQSSSISDSKGEKGKEQSSKTSDRIKKTEKFEKLLPQATRLAMIIGVVPSEAGLSTDRPQVEEVPLVGGKGIQHQYEYAKQILGKTVRAAEFLKPGSFVDAIAVTKGKGFEGPVTRFGVKRKQHKSRKSVRAVGVISPWHPATVMYTVPRAGQMGFHQRIALNNRVLFVGNTSQTRITPPGGFEHFGEVRGDFAVLKGSIPGPPKRFVDLRLPLNPRKGKIKEPRIIELNIAGQTIRQLVAVPIYQEQKAKT
jgi:large subunit ribosomal protein L3